MTDQVDVGWASPPFGLKEIDEGKIRVVARATDAALVRGQTIRVVVANADALAKRKDVFDRFMKAYRETIDYMYSDNPQVIKDYAEFVGVTEAVANRVRDDFFPRVPGRARRNPRHRLAAGRGGDAEVHPGTADQGAGDGAGEDSEVVRAQRPITQPLFRGARLHANPESRR